MRKIIFPYGTKQEIMRRLLGPESDRDLQMQTWLNSVWAHFRLNHFSVELATDVLSCPKRFRVIYKIMKLLLKGQWLYVVSTDIKILQALALVCPMTYMLTTRQAGVNVTTKQMMDLFLAPIRPDPDNLIQSDAFTRLRAIKEADLLVWDEIGVRHAGAHKLESQFTSILKSYFRRSQPVLMLHLKERGEATDVDGLLKAIGVNVGPYISAMIDTNAQFIVDKEKGGSQNETRKARITIMLETDPDEQLRSDDTDDI